MTNDNQTTPKPTAIQAIRDEIEMALPAVQSELEPMMFNAIFDLDKRLKDLEAQRKPAK